MRSLLHAKILETLEGISLRIETKFGTAINQYLIVSKFGVIIDTEEVRT